MAFFKRTLAVVVLLSVVLLAQCAPVEVDLKPVVRGDDAWCKGLSDDECKDYVLKHQEAERKRQEEAMKLREEKIKETIEKRSKIAEEVSKEIEEAVKNVQDGKRGLPTGNPWKMNSTVDLYLTAALGKGIGKCKITTHPEEIMPCYHYFKCRVHDVHMDYGFPKQTLPDGSKSGSGCVEQKDGPKGHDGACRYSMPSYGLTDEQQWRICSDNGYFNAVNMLKMAMEKGSC